MKTLSSASFFRVFDLLIGKSNPGLKRDSWTIEGVRFERQRHTFSGPTHSFAIDVFTVIHGSQRHWSLMVVKEFWWDSAHKHSIKTQSWSKATEGSGGEILTWFRAREPDLARQI